MSQKCNTEVKDLMKHRLYIIEGLPCSGKSTTSEYVAKLLTSSCSKVSFVDEGSGAHPADYEFHSYISADVLADFSGDELYAIKSCSEGLSGGYIVPLCGFSGSFFEKLLQYKIYDFLPWETEKPLMLRKWKQFRENIDMNTTYVFNCCFLQNPMCETMMRFGFTEHQSYEYISDIADIISPLTPMVIYLRTRDISSAVQKASVERDGWLDAVIDYHVNGAYGKSIAACGFDGYIACLEERQRRELSILDRLPVESVVIDDPQADWNAAYALINDILKC